jgi:hypothetical protein
MKSTLDIRILELLSLDQSALLSIRDISKRLTVAYSHAHLFIKKLSKENIIAIKKIGNVSICQLNFKNPLTLSYLSMIASTRTSEWISKNPHQSKLLENIRLMQDSIHCVLIKNNRIILIIPEHIQGVDFSVFRNRVVLSASKFTETIDYYKDAVIIYGAEKFFSLKHK